ncbi:MAG: hypothetical protein ACYCSI_06525 [Solirubrobacteraceae bacterium]
MAGRYARRAKIAEDAVTISFGYSSFAIAVIASVLEELPYIGFACGLLFFYFHRTVLVTEQQAYVFRDLPFHQPGKRLGQYPHGPDTVTRVRGKLTFSDGVVVWHSPILAWRVRQVAEAIQSGGRVAATAL